MYTYSYTVKISYIEIRCVYEYVTHNTKITFNGYYIYSNKCKNTRDL